MARKGDVIRSKKCTSRTLSTCQKRDAGCKQATRHCFLKKRNSKMGGGCPSICLEKATKRVPFTKRHTHGCHPMSNLIPLRLTLAIWFQHPTVDDHQILQGTSWKPQATSTMISGFTCTLARASTVSVRVRKFGCYLAFLHGGRRAIKTWKSRQLPS